MEREAGDMVAWGIPVWVALSIMPAGFRVIAGAADVAARRHGWRGARGGAGAGRVAAAAAALALHAGHGFVLAGAAVLIVATALGMPIFATLGGAALLMFWSDGVPPAAVPGETYRLAASPMLPAIPLFTLGGYIFSEGGASRRLMRTFTALVGWMPGGLAIVTTLLLAFFTPFTGASGVTILSMGGLLLPMLIKARYPENTSHRAGHRLRLHRAAVSAQPAGDPLRHLRADAHRPAVPGGPGSRRASWWWRWPAGAPGAAGLAARPGRRSSAREAAAALWEAKWELLLPVVVLTGIFGGFATLVEAAALTVLYAVVVECFVYQDLRFRDGPAAHRHRMRHAGGRLPHHSGRGAGLHQLPDPRRNAHAGAGVGAGAHPLAAVFLLALNVFLLIVGALMDIYSAILVVVPLITAHRRGVRHRSGAPGHRVSGQHGTGLPDPAHGREPVPVVVPFQAAAGTDLRCHAARTA